MVEGVNSPATKLQSFWFPPCLYCSPECLLGGSFLLEATQADNLVRHNQLRQNQGYVKGQWCLIRVLRGSWSQWPAMLAQSPVFPLFWPAF